MYNPTSLPIFPGCPTYGFTSSPDYLVKIVSREGGFEQRDRKWQEPLHTYSGCPLGPRPQADIEAIANFWHAMGGCAEKFLFKDWADYKSGSLDAAVAALDQPFEVQLGSPGGYQCVKQYTHSGRTTTRTIRHPIGSTFKVANEFGVEQAASRWTLDEDTGLLTPGGSFIGTPTRWGAEFYVPCRFDGKLDVEIVNYKIESLRANLIEVRPDEG